MATSSVADMKSKVLFDACSKNIQDDVESNINSESIPLLGRRPMRKGDGINFFILVLGILLFGGVTIGTYLIHEQNRPFPISVSFDLVERDVWGALERGDQGPRMDKNLVRHVVIMHTKGPTCHSFTACNRLLRAMQLEANATTGSDIPYNFLIANDGQTYQARGWSHQSGFVEIPQNSSLTIGFMGNFSDVPPPANLIDEAHALILESVRRGKLLTDYKIYGIRHLADSHSDGMALFKVLAAMWSRWDEIITIMP